jgi:hypothetical protein
VKLQRKQSQRKSERRNHRLGKPQSSAKHAMVRPLPQPAPISSTLPGLAELQSPSDTCPRAATAREHFPCSRPSYTNARPPHNPVAHLLRGSTSIRLGLRPPHSPDPPRAAATSSPLRNPADEPCPRRCDTSSPGCTAPSHRRPRPSPKARRTQPPSAFRPFSRALLVSVAPVACPSTACADAIIVADAEPLSARATTLPVAAKNTTSKAQSDPPPHSRFK